MRIIALFVLIFGFTGCKQSKCALCSFRSDFRKKIEFPYGIKVSEYISIYDRTGEIARFYLDKEYETIQGIELEK